MEILLYTLLILAILALLPVAFPVLALIVATLFVIVTYPFYLLELKIKRLISKFKGK